MSRQRTRTGWRLWRLGAAGLLYPPFASVPPDPDPPPWRPGWNTARCEPTGHRAPAVRCNCGLRADPSLDGLYAYLFTTLSREGVAYFGAIGRVELAGRIYPKSLEDPPGLLRAQRARLLELHVAPAYRCHVRTLAEILGVPVHLGLPGWPP